MKIRNDIVQTYREVHSWVGIFSALFLFVAFYAGAITMFEQPIQNWLSSSRSTLPPTALDHVDDLINQASAAHPELRNNYSLILTNTDQPGAYLSWSTTAGHQHGPSNTTRATLDSTNTLQVIRTTPSQTAFFIDVLHQQVGLPLPHQPAMLFMGCIALLYAIALVSGVLVFLPTIAKTLFAVRIDHNIRKKWLDIHNLFGFLSLPFHIVMAITSVVFAFHEQIFDIETLMLPAAQHGPMRPHQNSHPPHPQNNTPAQQPLPVQSILHTLQTQAAGFHPTTLTYMHMQGQFILRVSGYDDRYSHRGPNEGFATLNPYTGRILVSDYLPGHQPTGFAILTTFFALHFGSFGGLPVRWGYVVLGFGGAFLFYTGNRLWIDVRRRKERKQGIMQDTRTTRILECLTYSVPFGCISGISCIVILSAIHQSNVSYQMTQLIYYSVFTLFIISSLLFSQTATRTAQLYLSIGTTCIIPLACLYKLFLT